MIFLLACASAEPEPVPEPEPASEPALTAPTPTDTTDRWAEIVALATPEPCSPAPAALAEALARETRDPEEIRVQLGAWHAAQPDVHIRFADPGPVAGTTGVLAWSDWILDGELPAWVHLLSSLDRCGNLETAVVAASHADRLCAKRGAAFSGPAREGLRWTPIRTLAAREAVVQVTAVDGAGAERVEDLKRYLEAWILDGGAGALPPVEKRPLVALTRAAMDESWTLLGARRAAADACLQRSAP